MARSARQSEMRGLIAVIVASIAAACATPPRVAPARASLATPAESEVLGEPMLLRGYLGRAPIEATLVATDSGWLGCFRFLGTKQRRRVTGTAGAPIPRPPECPECDPKDDSRPEQVECRFEAGSGDSLIRTVDARCTLYPLEPSVEIEAVVVSANHRTKVPFFLGPTSYGAPPDAAVLALSRALAVTHACAPFVDLLDVRTLPRQRKAVLYNQSFPCDERARARDAPPRELAPELRLASFVDSNPSQLEFALPVPGESNDGMPWLKVYELAPGVAIYEVGRHAVMPMAGNGRTLVTDARRLFAIAANGEAGKPLELPEVQYYDTGCDPFDDINVIVAELDEAPPAEVVVELRHIVEPCHDGPGDPAPDVSEYSAHRFDPQSAHFERLKMSSDEIAVKGNRRNSDDISRPEESWQLPASPAAESANGCD
jgi:hypothetical protein